MKKILLFVLSTFIIIGGAGCMKKDSNEYKQEILTYLEQKYEEIFVVDSMMRQKTIGKSDVVKATCHSEKYPNENFEVNYHLDIRDVHNSEEIVDFLKAADVYDDEQADKWESDVEPYFEDNYSNVIQQHLFDESINLPSKVSLYTKITTPNAYPNVEESFSTIENYCNSDNYDVYAFHYIFVEAGNRDSIDDSFIEENIVKSCFRTQKITVFVVDSIESIESDYYRNYDNRAEFFENAGYVLESNKSTYYEGIKQN